MTFRPPDRFNIAGYFLDQRIEEGRGDRIALRTDTGELTYRQVQALSNQFAQALAGLGVRSEERALIALRDTPEFVGAFFGVLKLGAVVVMVNPDLESDNLAALLDYSRASCVVVDSGVLSAFETAAQKSSREPCFLVVGSDAGGRPSFDESVGNLGTDFETRLCHPDDPAIWLFSGGTTGRPKAVVQTHRSFANTTECYAKNALGYAESDVTLSVPKLFFGYATGSNLLFPFSVGASAVLFPERPTAEVLFEKAARHGATILVNVPTMINQMVGHADAGGGHLATLRFATSAGEALPAPLYHRWKQTFGVELLDGLGTAEMWHIFLSNTPDAVKPGTLGRAVPGFEVRVCDESGHEVPDGEVGQLWVRGDSRAIGYWQNIAKTSAAFRGEWFVGGDLVQRDAEGYVSYRGRGDDVLKVGGKWLAPQEVESCLMRHEGVDECAVVGVTNADGLTKPIAFVVPKEQRAPESDLAEELKAFVLEHLQPYKHPRRVHLVEAFKRTHLGKIDRTALKKLATELAGEGE
ncbi:MAG: benzoate-CoA ligase family protein [Thermoanaerobaculia bacterium]